MRLEHSELRTFSNDVIRIDVPAERCEITGGAELDPMVRELMTAFLCCGLNRVHVFGGPSRLTSVLETLVRHQSFMLTTGGAIQADDGAVQRAHMIVLWKHPNSDSSDSIFDCLRRSKSSFGAADHKMLCCSQAQNLVTLMGHMLQHIEQ